MPGIENGWMKGASLIELTIYWRKYIFIKQSHVTKNEMAAVISVMSKGPRCFEDLGIHQGGTRGLPMAVNLSCNGKAKIYVHE